MTTVEVRPIPRKKWHGKSGKDDFSQGLVLECLFDSVTGKFATGLTEEEKKRLEKTTGYDLSDTFDPDHPHPFWSTKKAQVRLGNKTTIFRTDTPLDEIKIKVLKASRFVANSMREFDEGLFPDALFVIYDEVEQVKIQANRIQTKRKAFALANKLTIDEKVSIIQILSRKSLRNHSADFLDVEIDHLIEEDTEAFIAIGKMDKEKVYTKATLLEGIHKNVLTKEGNRILYMGDVIGLNIDNAVEYFLDPNNQILKAAVLEKITIKTK